MQLDAAAIRGGKPIVFTNLKTGEGVDQVISWIQHDVLFEPLDPGSDPTRVGV
jgi:urease accessory protein